MRILYISSANFQGGGSIALYNMVKGIKELGHEVHVVTTKEDGYLIDKLDEIACPYTRLDLSLDIYPTNKDIVRYLPRILRNLWRHYRGVKDIVKIIESFRPDIVHTNVGPYSVGYDACQKTGIKHVWHQREYQDKDFGMRYFPHIRSFMRKSHSEKNYNICITKGIFNYRNFRKDKDAIIYDGVFSEMELSQLPVRQEKNYILFVGRIEEAKGLYEVLEAFYAFHKTFPDIPLKVVGDTPEQGRAYEEKCKKFISERNLAKHVYFIGRSNKVYEYMSRAKMMVVASRFEGFGFITAEAMLNGCPVIGKNTGGTKEQFDNGRELMQAEIALRYNSRQDLTEAMCFVMEHDTTDMCAKAKETVLRLYSLERNTSLVEENYKKILKY